MELNELNLGREGFLSLFSTVFTLGFIQSFARLLPGGKWTPEPEDIEHSDQQEPKRMGANPTKLEIPSDKSDSKPRLLDLFCCAGGAGVGYARAGFEVVGVDINPQPH